MISQTFQRVLTHSSERISTGERSLCASGRLINWIDASSPEYLGFGCLAASDCTVHLFADETNHPVDYPLLQHVLLSTRKSLAWNPDYWFTQPGDHHYRMALFPHAGGWRSSYREGFAFNYPLTAFVAGEEVESAVQASAQVRSIC